MLYHSPAPPPVPRIPFPSTPPLACIQVPPDFHLYSDRAPNTKEVLTSFFRGEAALLQVHWTRSRSAVRGENCGKDGSILRNCSGMRRIMTVKQENVGTKKDFGVAGFYREPNAAYLIFPKSLQAYEGKRVVGIKYDLLAKSKPKGPMAKVRPQSTGTAGPAAIPQKAATARPPDRFRVTIRFTAPVETALEVEAENKTAAKEQALKAPPTNGLISPWLRNHRRC